MKRIKIAGITLFLLMAGASTSFAQGWSYNNSAWYYVDEAGTMQTGWVQTGDYWYYLKTDGSMAHQEWIEDNGIWYYLEESGIWNADMQKMTDEQREAAAEEERYQQWLQSIYAREDEPLLN